jgi:preprotein translocase SecE subunit
MNKIANYLKETKVEMSNVVWPKWPLTMTHTGIVIAIALIVGYLSGFFDSIMSKGLAKLLGL